MSTGNGRLTVRGIDIEIVYKDIKNLHIGVYPPAGRVRVAAPKRLDEDRIRLAVIQRLSWIKQQQKQLRDAVRQSEREMVTGESHYVWGSAADGSGSSSGRAARTSKSITTVCCYICPRVRPGSPYEGAPALAS